MIEAADGSVGGAWREADTRRGRKPEGKDADGDDGDGGDGGASDTSPQPKKRGHACERRIACPSPRRKTTGPDPDGIMKTSADFSNASTRKAIMPARDHRGGRAEQLRRRQRAAADDARCGQEQHRPSA